jgi:hypothetical protein
MSEPNSPQQDTTKTPPATPMNKPKPQPKKKKNMGKVESYGRQPKPTGETRP